MILVEPCNKSVSWNEALEEGLERAMGLRGGGLGLYWAEGLVSNGSLVS